VSGCIDPHFLDLGTVVTSQRYVTCSARGGHFSKGLEGYNIGKVRQFLKKYLQCVLAARIFTVDFVVCILTVKKK
jgi:hypothetical protein